MSCIWSSIFIQCMVCITVVSNDDNFIIISFGSFYSIFHAVVNSFYCFFDSFINTSMSYHITVSIVYYDEIVLLSIDSFNQFIFHFVSTHFRFQVVSSNFRARNQDTIFVIVRSFTSTVEEECYVSIFFCFSNVELSLSIGSQIFAQCILYIFLIEQDMNTLERCIIRSHTVILQSRNSLHTCFRHILLSQYNSQFLCTVVTIVEEDNYITFLDSTIEVCINDRFDKFISYTFVVRFLHSLNHISSFLSSTVYQQVVSFFYTFPTFVTVHCIETTNNRSNLTSRLCTMSCQFFDKSFTTLRVCITTIHEAVDKCIFQSVFFSNVAQFEQVIQ